MDGGSRDNTVEIIRKYSTWISHWVSETDKGQSDAINKGFNIANGEIINWINSDDLLEPSALYYIGKAFIENKNTDFVCGKTLAFGKGINEHVLNPAPIIDKMANIYGFPHPQMSSFYRLQRVKEIGAIDNNLRFSMDYDLFVRIFLKGKMMDIQELVARFRMHPLSKTSTMEKVRLQEDKLIFSRLLNTYRYETPTGIFNSLGFYIAEVQPYTVHTNLSEKELVYSLQMFLKCRIYSLKETERGDTFWLVLKTLKASGNKLIFDHHLRAMYRRLLIKRMSEFPFRIYGQVFKKRNPKQDVKPKSLDADRN
jgi:glycosyltransferase involved in cell wall biosynthesis